MSLVGCDGDGTQPPEGDGEIVGTGPSAIEGYIVDASNTSQGIADAYIYVPIKERASSAQAAAGPRQASLPATHSAADGSYRLSGVPEGTQTIAVQPPTDSGYASMEIETDVPPGVTIKLRITLASQDAPIGGVVVNPDKAELYRRATAEFSTTVLSSAGAKLDLTPTWTTTGGIGIVDENGLLTAADEPVEEGLVVAALGGAVGWARVTVVNRSPQITAFAADPSPKVALSGTSTIAVIASDADGDALTYHWTVTGGSIAGEGSTVTWTPPNSPGDQYTVSCEVRDRFNGSDSASVDLTVNVPPAIQAVSADQTEVDPGGVVSLTCQASDPDGDGLTYAWTASVGSIAQNPSWPELAGWTASAEPGDYTITCTITDSPGDSVSASVTVKVWPTGDLDVIVE